MTHRPITRVLVPLCLLIFAGSCSSPRVADSRPQPATSTPPEPTSVPKSEAEPRSGAPPPIQIPAQKPPTIPGTTVSGPNANGNSFRKKLAHPTGQEARSRADNSAPQAPARDATPTPTPEGGSTPRTSNGGEVDALTTALSKLKTGNLAYSTPIKMKVGETGHVVARIAGSDISATALSGGLPQGSDKVVAASPTPVSPRMKMELRSADFDITALSSEEQIVAGDIPTNWEWDIVPKHSGKLSLHLAAVVELKTLSRDFASIDRDISVQVDPIEALTGFVQNNWQWIIATLTAVIGAAWRWIKTRKQSGPKATVAGLGGAP